MMIVHDVKDLLERGEVLGNTAVRVGVEKKGKRERGTSGRKRKDCGISLTRAPRTSNTLRAG